MSLTKVTYSMIDAEVVNVKDFGATTSDTVGTTNLAAIQAAIDTGKTVLFESLYTVNGTLYVNPNQRLYADKAWRDFKGAGLNVKFNSAVDINCITGKNTTTRSLQGCVFENLILQMDASCVFSDTITVNMISGSGRYIQIINCSGQNYSFAELAQNVTSITAVGTTATVTRNNHGLSNGDVVRMVGVSTPQVPGDNVYNGIFTIQNVTTNTFDYVMSGTPTNLTANINTYKSGYFAKKSVGITGSNINFSSFLYLDPLKTGAVDDGNADNYTPTFELLMTGCTTGNWYRDVLLQGRSPTTGSIGLLVASTFIANQLNSINPDYNNRGGNIQVSNSSNLMATNNIFGSLANNIDIGGDSNNTGIQNNYWEGGNSGTRRVNIANNTVNTLVNEYSIDPANGSVFDNSTAGNYTAYGYFGIQLKGGTLLNRYEEGVWTPQYEPTTGVFTSITYQNQNGKYVVVGDQVTVTCLISTDALDVGTSSGNVKIVGLPFPMDFSGNAVGTNYSDQACFSVNWGSGDPNQVRMISNTSYVVAQVVNSGASPTTKTVANMSLSSGVNYLSFTMTYKRLI
jgi:hypothetical protein